MGLRIDQLSPAIFARMAPADQLMYAPLTPSVSPASSKLDRLEREEQRTFANHCLRHGLAFVWHSTAHPTKASVGCPDFIVQVNGATLWIEFKAKGGKLSPEQEEFRGRLVRQHALYFIVTSAAEAIELLIRFRRRLEKVGRKRMVEILTEQIELRDALLKKGSHGTKH